MEPDESAEDAQLRVNTSVEYFDSFLTSICPMLIGVEASAFGHALQAAHVNDDITKFVHSIECNCLVVGVSTANEGEPLPDKQIYVHSNLSIMTTLRMPFAGIHLTLLTSYI